MGLWQGADAGGARDALEGKRVHPQAWSSYLVAMMRLRVDGVALNAVEGASGADGAA